MHIFTFSLRFILTLGHYRYNMYLLTNAMEQDEMTNEQKQHHIRHLEARIDSFEYRAAEGHLEMHTMERCVSELKTKIEHIEAA